MDPSQLMHQLFLTVASFIIWPVIAAIVGALLARRYAKRKVYREAIFSVSVFLGLILAVYIQRQ